MYLKKSSEVRGKGEKFTKSAGCASGGWNVSRWYRDAFQLRLSGQGKKKLRGAKVEHATRTHIKKTVTVILFNQIIFCALKLNWAEEFFQLRK